MRLYPLYTFITHKVRKQESEGWRERGRNEGRKKGRAGGKRRNIKIYKVQIQDEQGELSKDTTDRN